ncbi:hypothetical protein GCM10022207_72900 [Streptomyces lannensis]|uniref:Uncharacterized protein n=1 Tax=Streptomyces lannensis TaxID=766498 RepID=A0ABP7L6V3_9ACTN
MTPWAMHRVGRGGRLERVGLTVASRSEVGADSGQWCPGFCGRLQGRPVDTVRRPLVAQRSEKEWALRLPRGAPDAGDGSAGVVLPPGHPIRGGAAARGIAPPS